MIDFSIEEYEDMCKDVETMIYIKTRAKATHKVLAESIVRYCISILIGFDLKGFDLEGFDRAKYNKSTKKAAKT